MISVETYLSFINYEGIAATNRPIIGHVFEWEEPAIEQTVEPVSSEPLDKKKRTKRHWSQRYQRRFSMWLSGKGPKVEVIPYSIDDLRVHLERQFVRGMSWKNYAGSMPYRDKRRSWVVDHIVPKRLFGVDQVEEAYALTNLSPLWIRENMTKNAQRFHLV